MVDDTLNETLKRLLPDLKRGLGWGRLATFLVLALTGGAILASFHLGEEDGLEYAFLAGLIGVVGLGALNSHIIRLQQRIAMPHIVDAVSMEYQQNGRSFLRQLPPRLLPKGDFRGAEDRIYGKILGRDVQFAEVGVYKSRRRLHTLFRGYVLHFRNESALPAFFIAQRNETEDRGSKLVVDDLIEAHGITGRDGVEYGVWLSEKGAALRDPALLDFVKNLVYIERRTPGTPRLFSATSTGEEVHIAFSHRRDLFRIGGLLANEARVLRSFETARDDLEVPFRVAERLLEAEKQADAIRTAGSLGSGTSSAR